MKSTLTILSIALIPTLAQAEIMLDNQVEILTASEPESAKKVQKIHDLLQPLNTLTENSVSKTKTDSSKHTK